MAEPIKPKEPKKLIILQPGESFREGKVVNEREYQEQKRKEEEKKLVEAELEKSRPRVTKRRIVVDDETGQQRALVEERGTTETDITTFNQGIPMVRTIRGSPEVVRQRVSDIERSEFPRTITKPSSGIQKAIEAKQQLERDTKRIRDIQSQIQSGLVRQEAQRDLLLEAEQIQAREQRLKAQLSGRTQQPILTGISQRKQYTEFQAPRFKEIEEGLVSKPPERKSTLQKISDFAKAAYNYDASEQTGLDVVGGVSPGLLLFTPQGSRAVLSSRIGQYVLRGGQAVIGSFAAEIGIRQIGESTVPKQQSEVLQKVQDKGIDPRLIFNEALASEDELIRKEGGYDIGFMQLSLSGIGRELPGGVLISQRKKAFEGSIRSQAKDIGLSSAETNNLIKWANREKKFQAGGEFAGLLNIERGSESIGRGLLRRKFATETGEFATKKTFGTLFRKTAPSIAAAGTFEGAVGEVFQRQSRGQDQNFKAIALAGGVGAGFAGVTGGFIAGTAVTRPSVSKITQIGLNIADPLEYPGDVFQNIVEKSQERIFRKSILEPTITTRGNVFTFGVTTEQKKSKSQKKISTKPQKTGINTFDDVVSTKTKEPQKTRTFDDLITESENTFIPEPTPTKTPTPTPTETTTGTSTSTSINQNDIYNNIQERITTNINTNILASTTSTKIPTTTPFPRLPPPVPLVFPPGGTGGKGKGKRRSKFINEAQLVFSLFLGAKRTPTRKTNKSKKKIKREPTIYERQENFQRSINNYFMGGVRQNVTKTKRQKK